MASFGSKDVIIALENAYKKLPLLPKSITDFIVRIIAWVALVLGVIGLIRSIQAFSFVSYTFLGVLSSAGQQIIAVLIALAISVLLLFAFRPLREHLYKGWRFVFWAVMLRLVLALLYFDMSGVLIALIGFYLLFQVIEHFKKGEHV